MIPNALLPPELLAARASVAALAAAGPRFLPSSQAQATRRDSICWVGGGGGGGGESGEGLNGHAATPLNPGPGLAYCCALLLGLGAALEDQRERKWGVQRGSGPLNEALRVPASLQLARYERRGFYTAHRDNALGPGETILDMGLLGWLRSYSQRRRAITAILYLNDADWDCSTEGGALRCYPDAADNCKGGVTRSGTSGSNSNVNNSNNSNNDNNNDNDGDLNSSSMDDAGDPVDINPQGGSLLLFDSRVLLHQVCPVVGKRDRFALTAWIFGQPHSWYGSVYQDDEHNL